MEDLFVEVAKNLKKEEIADLCLKLVKVPSPTGEELEASRLYAEILRSAGLQVELQFFAEKRPNVIGRIPGIRGPGGLLLCGHIDTIPAEGCVAPKIESGRVYGRGTVDMKGALAAMAVAAKAIVASGIKLERDLYVCSYGGHEERVEAERKKGRGEGAIALAEAISRGKIDVNAAVVCEGPLDSIGIAHGGMAIFKITVEGSHESVHTTRVPLRSNPILWLAKVIEEIESMDSELNFKDWNRLIPQRPSLQIGIISGGDFFNRLPTSCYLVGTARWDTNETFAEVAKHLRHRLDRLEHRIHSKYDYRAKLNLEVDLIREACEVPEQEDFVRRAIKVASFVTGRPYGVSGWRAVYDLSIFYLIAGIPTIGFGPILPYDSTGHSDNESVSLENLMIMSKFYAALALDYCHASQPVPANRYSSKI